MPGPYMTKLVAARTGMVVQSGPFSGMRYIAKSHHSQLIPKWLGIYERELIGAVEEAIGLQPDTVVDVGAAEGYYAVGLALRMPQTRIIAFEMVPEARELLTNLAEINGVSDRITIRGACRSRDLAEVLENTGNTLVVCDVEGAEAYLLDPIRVPGLNRCHILVELHDIKLGGISEELRGRFSATHDIEHIWEEKRERSEFPYQTFYTKMIPSSLDVAVSEVRAGRMAWYWMRPLASAAKTQQPATVEDKHLQEPLLR
jgi:Met-10+ like-protein